MTVSKSNGIRLSRTIAGSGPPRKNFEAGPTAKIYRFKKAEWDRRDFNRIECITGAVLDFDRDCMHVGLYTDTRAPTTFFHSLMITVEDRLMEIKAAMRVEEVQVDGKNVLLRTSHLHHAINCTILPSPAAFLRIATVDGDMMQNHLLPLLDAGMD